MNYKNNISLEENCEVLFGILKDREFKLFRGVTKIITRLIGEKKAIKLLIKFKNDFLPNKSFFISNIEDFSRYDNIINNNIKSLKREQNIKGAIADFDNKLKNTKKQQQR